MVADLGELSLEQRSRAGRSDATRDYDGALSIDPRLPLRWRSLSIPIRFQDRQLRITLTHDEERCVLDEGPPLKLTVHGQSQTLTVDHPLVLAAGSHSIAQEIESS